MTQRFSLNTYDAFIDEGLIRAAEKLLTSDDTKTIRNIEKNIWVALFMQNNFQIETEIFVTGTKVTEVSCECTIFSEKKICEHVTAIILFIVKRKKQQKDKRAAEKQEITNAPPVRVTVAHILQRADNTQLIEFITAYARGDKQFALALKTRFLQDFYGSENSTETYQKLMEDTLRTVKNQRGAVTSSGWAQIFTILDELKQKSDSALHRGDVKNWFTAWSFSLKYVLRFLRMQESPTNKLEKRKFQLLENLKIVETLNLSPELKEAIEQCLIELCDIYGKFPFCIAVFDALMKLKLATEKLNFLLELVHKILASQSLSYEVNDKLTRTKIQLLQKTGQWEAARFAVITSTKNPDVIIEIIEETINNGDYETAEKLIQEVDKIYFDIKRITYQLNELSFKIAIAKNQPDDISAYGEMIFIENLDMDLFRLLKKNGLSSQRFERIIAAIQKRPYSIEKRDTLSALFFEEKNWDRLTALITELQSLELIKRYGIELGKLESGEKLDKIESIFFNYLQTHLGKPPVTRLRLIFEYFLENNALELTMRLTENIIKKFPERESLREEFLLMFEDFRRKQLLLKESD